MHLRPSRLRLVVFGSLLALLAAPVVFGHIRIYPMQSTFGAREKYTMRVPNERQSPTIRVEGDFPAGLDVYDFEFKPMLAINPKEGNPNMLWKFYQYYEDGFKEEFTAPPDAKMPLRPMPQVILTPDPASPKT